jgi:hypothetical protein
MPSISRTHIVVMAALALSAGPAVAQSSGGSSGEQNRPTETAPQTQERPTLRRRPPPPPPPPPPKEESRSPEASNDLRRALVWLGRK